MAWEDDAAAPRGDGLPTNASLPSLKCTMTPYQATASRKPTGIPKVERPRQYSTIPMRALLPVRDSPETTLNAPSANGSRRRSPVLEYKTTSLSCTAHLCTVGARPGDANDARRE